jgi:hypothetical protein
MYYSLTKSYSPCMSMIPPGQSPSLRTSTPLSTRRSRNQGPEDQLIDKWTGTSNILLSTHTSLRLVGIVLWILVKRAPPENNPADPVQ